VDKYINRESDLYVEGASAMSDCQMILNELFHSKGTYNLTGYANPKIDELIAAAGRETLIPP
jgi:ABC-type oligopeptide transport system substrate-binding subunit